MLCDRFGLPDPRRTISDRILKMHPIPEIGLVIVFESEDLREFANTDWRRDALHLNIKESGVIEISPDHLYQLMRSRKYEHFIWLSQQACGESDIRFAWVLAHELGHFKDNLRIPILQKAGHFLSVMLPRVDIGQPKAQNIIPTELSANLSAFNTVRALFSDDDVKAYMLNEVRQSDLQRISYELLLNADQSSFDVAFSTASFLRKHKEVLELARSDSADSALRVRTNVMTFDVDAVCEELLRLGQKS